MGRALDDLRATKGEYTARVFDFHVMAFGAQRLDDLRIKRPLHRDLQAGLDPPPRRIGGGLRVLLITQNAQHHLQMPLGLHRPAHQAERHQRRAVGVHYKARNDGVEWPLAWRNGVDVIRVQGETRAAILQADARARHHYAGTETHVVRLDKRDHHAALVSRRKIHGAARLRRAVQWVLRLLADQRRAVTQVSRVEHVLGGDAHVVIIGHMLIEVGQRQLHRLQHRVHGFSAVHGLVANAQRFEHAQPRECGDALAIGWQLVDHRAGVRHRQGVDPVHAMVRQVIKAHDAAIGIGVVDHRLRQLAAIERLTLGLSNQLQRFRVIPERDLFASLRRLAALQKALGKTRLILEQRRTPTPQFGDDRRDLITVARIANRRGRKRGEGQLAVAFGQRDPGRYRARHRHRGPTALGHILLTGEVLGGPALGRTTGCVQALQGLAVPNDGEGIAADAATGGFDHGQHHGGGDGGINGVAALTQHVQPGLCGQGLGAGDHVVAHHRRAGGRVRLAVIQIIEHAVVSSWQLIGSKGAAFEPVGIEAFSFSDRGRHAARHPAG